MVTSSGFAFIHWGIFYRFLLNDGYFSWNLQELQQLISHTQPVHLQLTAGSPRALMQRLPFGSTLNYVCVARLGSVNIPLIGPMLSVMSCLKSSKPPMSGILHACQKRGCQPQVHRFIWRADECYLVYRWMRNIDNQHKLWYQRTYPWFQSKLWYQLPIPNWWVLFESKPF